MGRPLRFFEPEGVYFVTGRCLQGRLLLRPSAETNATVAAVLARAIALFNVDVFAFVFLANHFHLILRSRLGQIPAFMQYLRSNIAKRVGRRIDWRGKFWDRRYDAAPIIDDDALVDRLRYILAHGVKEGLVLTSAAWPGLTCIPELTGSAPRAFAWPLFSIESETGTESNTLRLAVLPCWEGEDSEQRREHVEKLLHEIEVEARVARRGAPALGVRRILAQSPHSKPQAISCSPRPLCHSSTRHGREVYTAKYRAFVDAYRIASAAYRSGHLNVEFPEHSYRPPWATPHLMAA
jgi:REP element-mobilizing transposase RayT